MKRFPLPQKSRLLIAKERKNLTVKTKRRNIGCDVFYYTAKKMIYLRIFRKPNEKYNFKIIKRKNVSKYKVTLEYNHDHNAIDVYKASINY